MSVQQFLAAIGLVLCVALLVHHALGTQRQARLAWRWQAWAARMRLRWSALREGQRRRRAARASGQAAREAADVIERVRRGNGSSGNGGSGNRNQGAAENGRPATGKGADIGTKDGSNVVRPPRFGGRRDDLH